MKYIITESQLNLISELDRHWMDFKYGEQYERLKHRVIPYFENLIDSYDKEGLRINLYDSEGKKIMVFNKISGELYFDKSLDNVYGEILPHPFWSVNGKYILAEVFENLFPEYEVTSVRSAHIS